jgi:hypothetical protein
MSVEVSSASDLLRGITLNSLPRADASPLCCPDQLVPVTRRYQPEASAVEELIDLLYRLLVDVPANEPALAPVELTCLSAPPE